MTTPEVWQQWNGTVGRFWAEHADRYDHRIAALSEHLLGALDPKPTDRVLDIGCGCGHTSRAVAGDVPDGSVLGVDLSEPMVARARELAAEEGLGNLTFEAADVQEDPPAAGSYDLMLSRFGIMFFDDPAAAFAGLRQGLRAGGKLTFLCWREEPLNEHRTVPRAALGRVVELPPARDPKLPGAYSLADPDHVRALVTTAGFAEVSLKPVDEPLWLGEDAERAAWFAIREPTTRGLLEPAGPMAAERAVEALQEAYAPYETTEGVLLGGAAWLVTARA